MHAGIASGFLWSRRRGKSSRHSQHIHNLQIYVSGKRPIGWIKWHTRSREISRQLETLWRRMSAMSSHLKANCTQKIVQANEKKHIKLTSSLPSQRAIYTESMFMSWRHHVLRISVQFIWTHSPNPVHPAAASPWAAMWRNARTRVELWSMINLRKPRKVPEPSCKKCNVMFIRYNNFGP